jgi:transposase-like protein
MRNEPHPVCPSCQQADAVHWSGFNSTGSRRCRCLRCRLYFTPTPKSLGHTPGLRARAVQLYLEGTSLRAVGRLLGVNHQSVANWVTAAAAALPPAVSAPQAGATVEVDELYSYVGKKKPASMSSPPSTGPAT